jgi:hypothetical protein
MSFFLFLGALVALLSGIWLLILAFKEHILWGLGFLLVPFVSLIFVIMHWRRTWIPFVISAAGAGMMMVGLVSSLPSAQSLQDLVAVHAELERRVELGQMTEQNAARELFRVSWAMLRGADYTPHLPPTNPKPTRAPSASPPEAPSEPKPPEPLRPPEPRQAQEPEPAAPPEPRQPEEPEPTRYLVQEYVPIEFAEARQYVGRRARVKMRSGLTREGVLEHPGPRYLTLMRRVSGGNISYHIEPAKAERMEVLAWVEHWE